MTCAYGTPDQSHCKFNTNYSNNILITWGEVKNNAVIPPEHRGGPWPLRAGHFQLLCQSTAGLVWLWQREHNSPKSPWEALVMAPHPAELDLPRKRWNQTLLACLQLQPGPTVQFADVWVEPKEALWLGFAGIQGCSGHCMSPASPAGWSPTLERATWLREECPFEGAIKEMSFPLANHLFFFFFGPYVHIYYPRIYNSVLQTSICYWK